MARSELFSDTLDADNTTEAAFTPDVTEVTDTLADVIEDEAAVAAEVPAKVEPSDDEKAAAEAGHQVTVDDFIATASTAVEQADTTTSTISEADLDHVSNAYRNVTGGAKFKALAKKFIQEQMFASLKTPDDASDEVKTAAFAQAKAWSEVQQHIQLPAKKAPAEDKKPKPKANPAQEYSDRVSALQVALTLVENNRPEGVSEDWADEEGVTIADENTIENEAQALYDWTVSDSDEKGDAPDVSVLARNAVAVALGKGVGAKRKPRAAGASVSTYTGPRRNVAAHIDSAFSGVASGTFLTVSEIVAHESSEYAAGEVSAGAVSARLFPSTGKATTIQGVTPGENDKGVNGATKV